MQAYDTPMGYCERAWWALSARRSATASTRCERDLLGHARTMRHLRHWEVFIPGAEDGQCYKFEIQYADGSWHQKADPMARRTEAPPSTASITTSHFEHDEQ